MSVQFNHTIVRCSDQAKSATFLANILGLPGPIRFGPFLVVQLSNGVSLDFNQTDAKIPSQHYAFLIDEDDFDQIFVRIKERALQYWADPGKHRVDEINRNDGGRGLYFEDPDGHLLEVITRPYGGSV